MHGRRVAIPLGIVLMCVSAGCGGGASTGPGGPAPATAPPVAATAAVTGTPASAATATPPGTGAMPTASPASGPVSGAPTPAASSSAPPAGAPTATPAPVTSPTPAPAAPTPPAGPRSASSVYLGDLFAGAVLIYASGASGAVSPSAVIAGSATGFTDASGSSPIFGFAVDPGAGTVYVLTQTADGSGETTSEQILVFASGSDGDVAPSRTIVLPAALDAESLAFAGGALYVTDASGTGAIDVFSAAASGAAQPAAVFSPAGGFAGTPSVVSAGPAGRIYVATYDQSATPATEATQGVYVFPASANGVTAASELAGSSTGFGSGVLVGAAVDASGRVDAVVDDRASDVVADVAEFAAGATGDTAPATAFQDTSAQGPVSLAVDGGGTLYVSEIAPTTQYAHVGVFTPGATAAARVIQAYEAALPLVALGPYVDADASASTPVASARHGGVRGRRFLRRLAALRGGSRWAR